MGFPILYKGFLYMFPDQSTDNRKSNIDSIQ
jgi:hypothetical protein